MMLNIETYKTRKADRCPVYKTYRYAAFNTDSNGDTFEDQFNYAFKVLKVEIQQDRENNEINLYDPIVIYNVFIC